MQGLRQHKFPEERSIAGGQTQRSKRRGEASKSSTCVEVESPQCLPLWKFEDKAEGERASRETPAGYLPRVLKGGIRLRELAIT